MFHHFASLPSYVTTAVGEKEARDVQVAKTQSQTFTNEALMKMRTA